MSKLNQDMANEQAKSVVIHIEVASGMSDSIISNLFPIKIQ